MAKSENKIKKIYKGKVGMVCKLPVMNDIVTFHLDPTKAWVILKGRAFEVIPKDAQLLLNCYE